MILREQSTSHRGEVAKNMVLVANQCTHTLECAALKPLQREENWTGGRPIPEKAALSDLKRILRFGISGAEERREKLGALGVTSHWHSTRSRVPE
jgi:hypothetical protein